MMTGKTFYDIAVRQIGELDRLADGHIDELERIRANADLTAGAKDRMRRQLTDDFRAATQELVEKVRTNLERAQAGALAGLVGDRPDEQLENRKARASGRVTRLLEAGKSPMEAAQVFFTSGDVDAYLSLRDEVPGWAAINIDTVSEVLRQQQVEQILLTIDTIMAPALTGKLGEAATVRAGIDEQRARLNASLQFVTSPTPQARLARALANSWS